MKKTILLIDDDPVVLAFMEHLLNDTYATVVASTGQQGLQQAFNVPPPDLILLDLELPDLHGFEVCRQLKQNAVTAEIPVIFLSGHDDIDSVTHGFASGGVDFVGKPVVPPILMARIETQLRLFDAHLDLSNQNRHLEELVAKRTQALARRTEELQLNQDLMIFALGSIAETRDNETGLHIQRTRAYVERLTRAMPGHLLQRAGFAANDMDLIWKSAPLHDIGKVGIPDQILLKPGKLTTEEFEVMKQHTVLGHDSIRSAERRVQANSSILQTAALIAMNHHERWDGRGYPSRLAGEDIPLPARLMAVADAYDAMTSDRVYQQARPHDTVVEIIRSESGQHFDPVIVQCFLACCQEFAHIAKRLGDGVANLPLSLAKPIAAVS